MKQSLNGAWEFKACDEQSWLEGTVPGCNYLDLLDNQKIEDPFYKSNEKDVYWVAKKDWEYRRTFKVSKKDLKADRIFLCADMLDTICGIYINDKLAATAENCHIQYRFEVTSFLKEGENEIRVVFTSPVNYVTKKQAIEKCPRNANGQNGIPHIRKPQCHFGWDWGPVLPPSGISGDIYLDYVTGAKLSDIATKQVHKDGKVDFSVKTSFDVYSGDTPEIEVTLTAPNGDVLSQIGDSVSFHIEKPELWWTNELAPDHKVKLYTLTVALKQDGKVIDTKEQRIGLRTIELNRERDEYGNNFQFILNGVPLFIKGANFIPGDSFNTRFTDDKLKYMLDAMLFSNMNMIRIWGGGYYGSDALYDMCDEMGILVWQDFAFACQPYPFFDDDLLKNVKAEVKNNVLRLRNRASLAIWCGNNEIEAMSAGWATRRNYIAWTEKFFHQMLEPLVRELDDTTAFIPGSPCGVGHNKGIDADNVGDTHLWAVWHGLQPMNYYRKRMTRFCSEFGFESLPDIKTIRTFADESDYALDSEVFTAHQKCGSGNDKMVYYIASRFHLPTKFEDFIYLSQVTQQECISDATEHWRRNKGHCNGAMYWQLNDCWPVCSWAGMDYYGNYKALQYTSRHFNAPLSVSIEDEKDKTRIVVINDFMEDKDVTVRYKVFDFNAGVQNSKATDVHVGAVANKEVFVFDMEKLSKSYDLKHTGLLAELLIGDEVVSRKTVLFDREKNLALPKAKLQKEVKVSGQTIEVTVSSDTFARLVRVDSDASARPFSDNYFDLLPGEKKTVTLALQEGDDAEKIAKSISLFCCTDVESENNTFAEKVKMAKIFMQPLNIGNFIWYGNPNTEYKL